MVPSASMLDDFLMPIALKRKDFPMPSQQSTKAFRCLNVGGLSDASMLEKPLLLKLDRTSVPTAAKLPCRDFPLPLPEGFRCLGPDRGLPMVRRIRE